MWMPPGLRAEIEPKEDCGVKRLATSLIYSHWHSRTADSICSVTRRSPRLGRTLKRARGDEGTACQARVKRFFFFRFLLISYVRATSPCIRDFCLPVIRDFGGQNGTAWHSLKQLR